MLKLRKAELDESETKAHYFFEASSHNCEAEFVVMMHTKGDLLFDAEGARQKVIALARAMVEAQTQPAG